MRKLSGPSEMEKGGVYNLVYKGSNEAYAKINGKRTILVIEANPFTYVELYEQYHKHFGSSRDDDLRGYPSIVDDINLALAFKEDDIFEPADESEWFKHSLMFTSLEDAIKQGVLTEEGIERHPVRSNNCPFTTAIGRKGEFVGVYTRFHVEGRTPQPYLQGVYVHWSGWEEMYADFKKYGVNARH